MSIGDRLVIIRVPSYTTGSYQYEVHVQEFLKDWFEHGWTVKSISAVAHGGGDGQGHVTAWAWFAVVLTGGEPLPVPPAQKK